MTIPNTAAELFEKWIPARFAEFLATNTGKTLQPNEHCSVVVTVDAESWLLQIRERQLTVTSSPADAPASFRLQVSGATLERFVLSEIASLPSVPEHTPPSSPLLKLLSLDDEFLELVQAIPGGLRLVVKDGETQYSATLGPGSRPVSPAACTMSCTLADAELLRGGKVQPMELFFGGRIQLEGDPQVAMGLAGLLL